MTDTYLVWLLYMYLFICLCLISEHFSHKPKRVAKPPVDKNYITEVETW